MGATFRSIVLGCALLAGAGVPAMAQDDLAAGRAEYQKSCANCHGDGGKGDGAMAQYLTIKPADLTALKKANNGEYPFLKVFQTIDGRAVVKAHGAGPMPIWGDRYQAEAAPAGAEPYRTYTAEALVRTRLLELTYFIQSLQE